MASKNLMHGGMGLMNDITYVGLDVHKATVFRGDCQRW